nr:ribonuclease H-like domain-containing protein [Tanacetum cinerariifolium]
MDDMMNLRRREDPNCQRSEDKESENSFFEGDSSSSDKQQDRPRTLFAEPIIWDIWDEDEESMVQGSLGHLDILSLLVSFSHSGLCQVSQRWRTSGTHMEAYITPFPELFAGAIYAKNAYEMWTDLNDTYDKVHGLAFDAMICLPTCTCYAAKELEKHNQLIKLIQFLMGLDDSYLAIRSNILSRETLPLVKQAFAIISGEESYRDATSHVTTKPTAIVFSAKAFDNKRKPNNKNNFSKNRGPNLNLTCTNCNKPGHTIDRCHELIGYPGYVKRNFNAKPNVPNNASADVFAKNSGTDNKTSNSHVSLTGDQLSMLMNLLNDSGVSCANSSMGGLTVGHPNGTQALITKIGDSKINNNITLYDVLVVPEYTVSLLSVYKLARDSKLFVGFDEHNFYFQDLKGNKTMGIGRQWRVTLNDDGTQLTLESQDIVDSKATSISENTHPEGNVSLETTISNETYLVGEFNDNTEPISEISDLPVNSIRRSTRQTKLPSSLNDFIINGKVKYGVEKVVNYANLDHNSLCFAFGLNKSIKPTCYEHVILDSNWIDAMNTKIEALNKNHTWFITDFPANKKPIKCKWIYKIKDNKFIALLVYVDDIVITGNCVDEIDQFKTYLKSKFNIKYLGSLKYFLGIEVIKTGKDLCLTQRKYCIELLKEYGLLGCKPTSTHMEPNFVLPHIATDSDPHLDNIIGYQQLLGKLIYLMHTRLDISYSIHCFAQHMHSPLKSHLNSALNVLRYLKNAPRKGIKYAHSKNDNTLVGFSDADWAKCIKTRKSITGYYVQLVTLVLVFLTHMLLSTLCAFSSTKISLVSNTIFDVMKYGARGDGKTNDSPAYMNAWKETCQEQGNKRSILVIPKERAFLLRPISSNGPCKPSSIFVQV